MQRLALRAQVVESAAVSSAARTDSGQLGAGAGVAAESLMQHGPVATGDKKLESDGVEQQESAQTVGNGATKGTPAQIVEPPRGTEATGDGLDVDSQETELLGDAPELPDSLTGQSVWFRAAKNLSLYLECVHRPAVSGTITVIPLLVFLPPDSADRAHLLHGFATVAQSGQATDPLLRTQVPGRPSGQQQSRAVAGVDPPPLWSNLSPILQTSCSY